MKSRMKFLATVVAVLTLASAASASDFYDFLNPHAGTQPVAEMGGDSLTTLQVSCSSNTIAAGATLLKAATNAGPQIGTQASGRPQRKRCFQNNGLGKINLGSSTVATADFYVLGESTSTYGVYCTNNTAAIYCAPASPITTTQTVNILVESQSQP